MAGTRTGWEIRPVRRLPPKLGVLDMIRELTRRLIDEDDGQDLIEYGLLTGAIGFWTVSTNRSRVRTNWRALM